MRWVCFTSSQGQRAMLLATDRSKLRRQTRAQRAAYVANITRAEKSCLAKAAADLLMANIGLKPGVAATYAPIGDEIDPAPAEALLLKRGWTLAWPRVPGAEATPLCFHACLKSDLRPGYSGIAEPPSNTPPVTPTLVIVPLVAVDAAGNRLGQGQGHYDRTLAMLRDTATICAVGLCWDVQRVSYIPTEAHDEPLDALATPTRFQRFR